MDKTQIQTVIDLHGKYLRGESGGVRANLRFADLRLADLRFADLRFANLRLADLRFADLRFADLRFADLRFADLSSADLRFADLRSANLRSADLSSADLRFADLRSAVGIEDKYLKRKQILPEVGPFTGFKKLAEGVVAQLEITGERVGGVVGRKCRASEVTVVGFFNADETPDIARVEGRSMYDSAFVYRLGEVAKPASYDPSMVEECSAGIHFFLSFAEAAEFSL